MRRRLTGIVAKAGANLCDPAAQDCVLALVGVLYLYTRIFDPDVEWSAAPQWVRMTVVLAPLLVAVRRVVPVIAATGLMVASILTLVMSGVEWLLLAGCALALWSVAAQLSIRVAAVAVVAVAGILPWLANRLWLPLVDLVYPQVWVENAWIELEGGGVFDVIHGIPPWALQAIQGLSWPWTGSALLAGVWLAGLTYSLGQGRARIPVRTPRVWLTDVRTAPLWQQTQLLDVLLIAAAVTAFVYDIRSGQTRDQWWTTPGWMLLVIAYSPLILILRHRRPIIPVGLLAVVALVAYHADGFNLILAGAFAVALYSLAVQTKPRVATAIGLSVLGLLPIVSEQLSQRYKILVWLLPALKQNFSLDKPPPGRYGPEYEIVAQRTWPVLLSVILLLSVIAGLRAGADRRSARSLPRDPEVQLVLTGWSAFVGAAREVARYSQRVANTAVRWLRARSGDPASYVVLAIVAVALTQVWVLRESEDWVHARLGFPLFVVVVPVLIALCRLDPALAAGGLAAGLFGSLLVGNVNWALLIGCCLAMWWLPSRCSRRTVLLTIAGVALLPFVADLLRFELVSIALPSVYDRIIHSDGSISTVGGITRDRFERIYELAWPWWFSLILVLVGLAAMLWWSRHCDEVEPKEGWERRREMSAFLARPDRALLLETLVACTVSSLVLLDIVRDVVKHGNWWSAPGWMPYAIVYSALTLVLRRRWPVVPVVVLAISSLLAYWQTSHSWSLLGALGLALYSLAAGRMKVRWILLTGLTVLAAIPLIAELIRYPQMVLIFPELKHQSLLTGLEMGATDDGRWHNPIYEDIVDRQWPVLLSVTMLVPLSLGLLTRLYLRNRRAAEREAELERLAAEQDEVQVVLTERSHIARDLHDVVAHAVNLMVIQAETGPDLIRRGDADVLAGFQRIGDAGRRALSELDRMLSALRDEDGVPDPELAPQPGLAELRQLIADVSHDGLTVELSVVGDLALPPEGQQLAAYRLVQEALTNVVRHAEATKATVTVEIKEAGVKVEVVDDGQGFEPEVARASGRHGLAGMRERVRIHEGELTITSAPGEGASVAAWIPVPADRRVANR